MSMMESYLSEQVKSFTLNLLANKPCTQEDILRHFESFSTNYTLAEGTLCVVLKQLEDEGKIEVKRSEGEGVYSLSIGTDDLPIFALSGYTPSELNKTYSIQIYQDLKSVPEDVSEALVVDGRKHAIYIKNTVLKTKVEKRERETDPESKKKEGKKVQKSNSIAVLDKEKTEEVEEIIEAPSTPIVDKEKDTEPAKVEESEPEEDPVARKKKLDALKLLGFFDEPKSKEDIEKERKAQEELENKKREEERLARLKEEEEKKNAILAKKAEEKAKEEEFSKQQAISTRKASELPADSSTLQRKLSKYIEDKEIENKYNFENIIKNVFVDVPQPLQMEEEEDIQAPVSSYAELKDLMANRGYTIKPYVNNNTFSYYSNNFIFTNKLNRDVSIITYAFILIECILGYFLLDKMVNRGFVLYLAFALVCLIIPVFFLIKYFIFPTKRKEAVFKFRLSLATSFMIYANIMVLIVLFSIFTPSLRVTTEDISTMILPIFFPAILLFNIPISVCIYSLLYHTKKYHLH